MAELGLPTQAITEDFGGIVQQGANMLNQQQLQREAKEEKDYQKKLDFEDRYGIDESLWQLGDTGLRTVDDVTTEALSQSRDAYYETYKALEKDPTNLQLKKKLNRITNSVTQMGKTHKKYAELGANFLEMLQNDEVSGVDEKELEDMLSAVDEGRAVVKYDDDFQMNILLYDKDNKLMSVTPYGDLEKKTITKKIDVDTEVNELVTNLGGLTVDTKQGSYIRTQNKYGDKQKETVNNWVDAQLEDPDRFADLLYQATGGSTIKKEGFDDVDKQSVRNFIQEQVAGKYTEVDSLKADPVALAQQRAAAAATKANTKAVTADDVQIGSSGDEPMITSDGHVFFSVGKGGVAIDPNKKLSRMVSGIMQAPDGTIKLRALDTEKIKGVQGDDGKIDKEATAAAEKTTVSSIFAEPDEDGVVTYYKRVPKVIDFADEPDAINVLGNLLGVQDENGIRQLLKSKFFGKYQNKAQEFYDGKLSKPEKESPKTDAFGNPL